MDVPLWVQSNYCYWWPIRDTIIYIILRNAVIQWVQLRPNIFCLLLTFIVNILHYVCKFSVAQPRNSSFLAQWLQAVLFIQPMSIINACLIQHTIKADAISSDVQCLEWWCFRHTSFITSASSHSCVLERKEKRGVERKQLLVLAQSLKNKHSSSPSLSRLGDSQL